MPLQATSGAASYDAFGGGVPVVPNYIEDVFSTWLYTGTGASQTITNGIDLSTKGGLVWIKSRGAATNHNLFDTTRGATKSLHTNSLNNAVTDADSLTAFNTTGFTLGSGNTSGNQVNTSADTFVSWSLRKQPKFFDVVTWTGNDASGRAITHNLGSVPGFIVVKNIDSSDNKPWPSYHRSLGATKGIYMAYTNASEVFSGVWNNTEPTSTQFTVGYYNNSAGVNYVAYLFAHDAGGFGLTGTDNVISCGSFTTDSGGNATVTLGYEPAWLMFKCSSNSGQNWEMVDTMRGWSMSTDVAVQANSSAAEASGGYGNPTATGFVMGGQGNTQTYIYIAIRRGPMKVPTSGTSVFAPVAVASSTSNGTQIANSFVTDMAIGTWRDGVVEKGVNDRLRGISTTNPSGSGNPLLKTNTTGAETTPSNIIFQGNGNATMLGQYFAGQGYNQIYWLFGRAPSFFDEVCYTVSGYAANNIAHNLTVTPDIFITKPRGSTGGWTVYGSVVGSTNNYMTLNDTQALQTSGATVWGATSTTFSEPSTVQNGTYVAYLFATCAGVSKVFSYTGNGSSQTINCGFTGGARWILIKRTDSTGDWYCWDSARGIVSGNDPHLSLNTTAAEVTSDDTIDTDSTGFVVNQVSATNVNVSSATYIGIAIA